MASMESAYTLSISSSTPHESSSPEPKRRVVIQRLLRALPLPPCLSHLATLPLVTAMLPRILLLL